MEEVTFRADFVLTLGIVNDEAWSKSQSELTLFL